MFEGRFEKTILTPLSLFPILITLLQTENVVSTWSSQAPFLSFVMRSSLFPTKVFSFDTFPRGGWEVGRIYEGADGEVLDNDSLFPFPLLSPSSPFFFLLLLLSSSLSLPIPFFFFFFLALSRCDQKHIAKNK